MTSGLEKRIQEVVRRVPRARRADVEAELRAHAEDGLAAGRPAEDVLATFGDPALIGGAIAGPARARRVLMTATAIPLALYGLSAWRLERERPQLISNATSCTGLVLDRLYGPGGALTRDGLAWYRSQRGKGNSKWARLWEPVYFTFPEKRADVEQKLARREEDSSIARQAIDYLCPFER